jgi:hypothetical protein
MKTKFLLTFLNRAAHFDADIELADVLEIAIGAGKLSSPDFIFEGVTADKHPRLAGRKISDQNRKIASGHLSNTIRASFVKDIYEDFSIYITDLIRGCAEKGLNPDRLIGEHKFQIDANQLIRCGSWDAVLALIAENLFRRLEGERSTIKLVTAIDAKLGLKLDAKIYEKALHYLELRHLLIHRDGIADKEFCDSHPIFNLKPGDKVILTYLLIDDLRKKITALAKHIDEKVVEQNLIAAAHLQN